MDVQAGALYRVECGSNQAGKAPLAVRVLAAQQRVVPVIHAAVRRSG